MPEIALGVCLAIAAMAFVAEYVDSSLGMGYGTSLTPALLVMGFEPMQVVPAVLLSELVTGLAAGALHHLAGNVDFRPRSRQAGVPSHLGVSLALAGFGVAGTFAAVLIAVRLPAFYLKLYTGLLVAGVGVTLLALRGRRLRFSWGRAVALGLVASFNKGMSGGGYGPLVTGGQVLAGIDARSAVGIASLAEGVTCAAALACYMAAKGDVELGLVPWLLCGAIASVPLSAYTVSRMGGARMRTAIGLGALLLGLVTLGRLAV